MPGDRDGDALLAVDDREEIPAGTVRDGGLDEAVAEVTLDTGRCEWEIAAEAGAGSAGLHHSIATRA
jgi:hypothetical protein